MTFWDLIRARYWLWRIVRQQRRVNEGMRVRTLEIPDDVADDLRTLALEYGERVLYEALTSMPREDEG